MITKINNNINFKGTTIIKKEGGSVLTKEIVQASNESRPGYINTRLNGLSIISVSNVFEKEEKNYHKYLKEQGLDFIFSTKILNNKLHPLPELTKLATTLVKTKLL